MGTRAGLGNRSANLIVTTLKAMLRWAVENEVVAHSPIEHVKKMPERGHEKYKRRALTDGEIERFLDAAQADDEENDLRAALEGFQRVPVLPLFVTLMDTGGRYGEVTKATWGDVDLAAALLTLRAENTKSKRQRVIPLGRDLVGQLTRLKVLHETVLNRLPRADERVFLSPEGLPWPWHTANLMRIFDRVLRSAGIQKVNAQGQKLDLHALRHCFASRLARNGVSLLHAQRLLGHADPALTANVYAHVDHEELREAIEKIHPTKVEGREAKEER